MTEKISIEITGDAASLISALKTSGVQIDHFADQTKKAGDTAKSSSGQMGSLNNVLTDLSPVSLTAAGAIGLMAAGLTTAVNLAREGAAVQAQLNAVLESTKGAAGLSADELNDMAAGLQSLTNYDDEATVGAESLLLTFTKIGEEVFPEALAVVLDMSTALGQDLKSSSIQVGKALNDPIEGVSALQRVGVSFTESQKEQIKTMVETGDVMGAQTLILRELQTEFGGSAAAAREADGGFIAAGNSLANLGEAIGSGLLPTMVDLNEKTIAAAEGWTYAIETLQAFSGAQEEASMTGNSLVDTFIELNPLTKLIADNQKGIEEALTSGAHWIIEHTIGWEELTDRYQAATDATDEQTGALGDNTKGLETNQEAIEANTKALEEQEKQQRELITTTGGYFADLADLRQKDQQQHDEYIHKQVDLVVETADEKIKVNEDLAETISELNDRELEERKSLTEEMIDLDKDLARSRERLNQDLLDLDEDLADSRDQLNRDLADLNNDEAADKEDLNQDLSDLNDDYVKDREELNQELTALNDEEIAEKERLTQELQGVDDARLAEELAALDESYAEKRAMIEEELAGLDESYDEKRNNIYEELADLEESNNKKREMIQEELADLEESNNKKRALIQEELADVEASYAEKRAKAQEELTALDADYAEKRTKAQTDADAEIALLDSTLTEKQTKLDEQRAKEEEANKAHLEELKLQTALHILETTGQLEELTGIAGLSARDAYDLVTAGIIDIDGEFASALQGTMDDFNNQQTDVMTTATENQQTLEEIFTGSFEAIGESSSEMANTMIANNQDIETSALAAASAYDRMIARGMTTGQAAEGARLTGQAAAYGALPSFDLGGVVPGPMGAPTPILAHGGEMVVPPGQGMGISIGNLNVYGVQDPQALFEAVQREARNRGVGFVGG